MTEDPLSKLQACVDVLSNLQTEAPPPIPPRTYGEDGGGGSGLVMPSAEHEAEVMETAFDGQDFGLQQSTLSEGQAGSFNPLPVCPQSVSDEGKVVLHPPPRDTEDTPEYTHHNAVTVRVGRVVVE